MLLGFVSILPLFEPSHVCITADFVYQAVTLTCFGPFFGSYIHFFIHSLFPIMFWLMCVIYNLVRDKWKLCVQKQLVFHFKYCPVICPYRCLQHETRSSILCGPTHWYLSSTESGLPHNKVILLLIYLFVIYFISVTRKNFKVGVTKLPVKLLLLQPYKFSSGVCSRWYINKDYIMHFYQRQEKSFFK